MVREGFTYDDVDLHASTHKGSADLAPMLIFTFLDALLYGIRYEYDREGSLKRLRR